MTCDSNVKTPMFSSTSKPNYVFMALGMVIRHHILQKIKNHKLTKKETKTKMLQGE